MASVAEFQARAGWSPVWWEVELWRGASWQWSATLHGCEAGTVLGGVLAIDGKAFPIMGDDQVISVSLTPEQVSTITPGAVAELYVDIKDAGRILWLRGKVTVGDNQ